MLVRDSGGNEDGLFVDKILLIFLVSVGEYSQSQDYSSLHYMKLMHRMSKGDERLECVRLRWSTELSKLQPENGQSRFIVGTQKCRRVVRKEGVTEVVRLHKHAQCQPLR